MTMPQRKWWEGYANGSGFAAMKEGAEKWNTTITFLGVLSRSMKDIAPQQLQENLFKVDIHLNKEVVTLIQPL